MRTKNSIYNVLGVIGLYLTKIVVNFLGKTALIKVMGDQYNGISGLFANIISVLSIAELGIGSAIIYNLYKPVKENDIEAIKSIMRFYRKCYHTIALIVLMVGLCILPFMESIVKDVPIRDNVYTIYLFYLADSVASYVLSYKRSLLYVYQKNYIISIFDALYNLFMQVSQIIILLLTHNFMLFLAAMVFCRVVENVCIHIYVDRHYSFLFGGDVMPVSDSTKRDIITKVKGLMFHNIGSYVVLGTDNILISKLIGVVEVGFYSNYNIIFGSLSSILKQIVTAVQASVGNLLVEKDYEKSYQIFRKLELLNFWLYSVVSISIFYVVQDFIKVWLGERYLFSKGVVFCLVLNFWQTGMRNAMAVFKGAAGIYYEDRFIPIAESVINIVASILLALKFGIAGIFIGTFISSLCLFLYSYPFLVYKRVFNRKPKEYYFSLLRFTAEWVFCITLTGTAVAGYDFLRLTSSSIVNFLIKGCLAFVSVNVILYVVHGRSEEFKYYIDLINCKIHKRH